MKLLAFNASPRKDKGTTDIILNYFMKAAEEAGATTEKFYVTDLDIEGCIGCFSCWTKTPGKCIHRDDMDWIIPKYAKADIIIFTTPIYNGNIIHYLQRMTERFLPTALPWQVENGQITRHPARYQRKPQKTVLISTAGFPDHQAFNIAKALFPNSLYITLPAAQILVNLTGTEKMKPFIDAVNHAARQLVLGKTLEEETIEQLNVEYSQEMRQWIREQANKYFENKLQE